MYLNKVMIIGNLTRDPELKALPSGSKVTSFSVATNYTYKSKESGEKKEQVEYHNIVVFGRIAELVAQYLKKGSQALVEGRLQTRTWEQDGQKKYKTEIIADTVQFGSRPSGGAGAGSSAGGKKGDKADAKDAPADAIEYPTEEINPDDIPF